MKGLLTHFSMLFVLECEEVKEKKGTSRGIKGFSDYPGVEESEI